MMADAGRFRPNRRYRPSRWRRLANMVMSVLVAAGLVPHSYLLTARAAGPAGYGETRS
jgi:hypothetical protein